MYVNTENVNFPYLAYSVDVLRMNNDPMRIL